MLVGDILLLLLIAGLVGYGGVALARMHGRSKAIRHIPAPALGSEDVPIADRLTHYYRIAQRSVRLLEHLRNDDYTIAPLLPADTKKQIDQIVNDFYE